MESNLVAEFVEKTGATTQEAYNKLRVKGWDLQAAIQDYFMEIGSLMSPKSSISEDVNSYKKLTRGISRATDNACVVSKARCELGLDFRENGYNSDVIEKAAYTFTLPDLSIHPSDFREFLERDLIDMSCLNSLEQAGRLNWWIETRLCQRLWPLSTTGDGNCLLHAASLGMWGFHDRLLSLRKALHEFLTGSESRHAIYRRWRWQLTRLNQEAGLVYTEEEWEKEWESIVSMASSTPRNCGRRRSVIIDKPGKDVAENATYESLEEIHILALAHVLKRAIVVIADTMLKDVNGENLAPIMFGGIYLPFEISCGKCHKTPLVLTYDAAHFSALVAMDTFSHADKLPQPTAVIPLTDSTHKILPLQFAFDPGEEVFWSAGEKNPGVFETSHPSEEKVLSYLRSYLDIVYVPLTSSPSSEEYDDSETPVDEEDIEKRFTEVESGEGYEDPSTDNAALFGNRSKAARQLQTVAKSFGSIGKSMSKKLKNFGKISRGVDKKDRISGRSDGSFKPDQMLCARLGCEDRTGYQEELVKNYLNTARTRFERENKRKILTVNENSLETERLQQQVCITPGCTSFGSEGTSYLCTACYEKQREQELGNNNINSPTLSRHHYSYGAGKSKFYVEAPYGSNVNIDYGASVGRLSCYQPNWHGSSSSSNRNTIAAIPTVESSLRRSNIQEVGNAIDGLGTAGRYTHFRTSACPAPKEHSSWEHENGPNRKIHSYNLTKESIQHPNINSRDGNVYCVKGTTLRSGSSNSTVTGCMSPQGSQDLPEIESVYPYRSSITSAEAIVTRIIPISVEASASKRATCLNNRCLFYGSPELENYCSKCYKGRQEVCTRSSH